MKCILAYEEVDFSRPYASPCCHIMPNDSAMNIQNITNLNSLLHTNVYQHIRKTMSDGEKDPICKVCWNEESQNILSDRVLENNIRPKRDTVELRSLKIALDYTCNMMCRICTPMLSSKWASSNLAKNELKTFNSYNVEYPKYDIKQIVENSDLSKLERLKLLGGEPFYSKKLDWFVDHLTEHTDFKNLKIYITTNGSVFPKKEILDKLLKCKSLHIEFSLDAIEDQTELCRWGVKWNTIHENIQKWRNLNNNKIKINAHCTMSIYNSNNMQPLVDYCKDNNIFLHVNKLRYPQHLCIDMVDMDTRKTWCLEGKTPIEKTVNAILLNKESIVQGSQTEFVKFNDVLDEYQKTKLKQLNREIYNYFYSKNAMTYDKNFCYAPFNQVYFGRNGMIKPCCGYNDSLGNYNIESVENVYNNDKFKRTRKAFLNGKFDVGCAACENYLKHSKTQNGVQEFSNFIANDNSHLSNQVLKEDLKNQKPVFLDILVSNNCNFACIGCGSDLSSTWAKNYTDIEQVINKDIRDIVPSESWSNNIEKILDYILQHKDTVQQIHLNGGEPFMQEQFYVLLQALIDEKLTDIKIVSHTNGSVSTYKGKDIVNDYLSYFAHFDVIFSHDHYGDRGHYIRYPLSDNKWLKNYNNVRQTCKVSVQTSYSIFNALTIDTLEKWYIDNNIDMNNWHIGTWVGPKPYTTELLQSYPDLLKVASTALKNLNKKTNLFGHLMRRVDMSKQNISLENFRNSISMWDNRRNTDFKKTFPELIKIYEKS